MNNIDDRKNTIVPASVAVIGELNVDIIAAGLDALPELGREVVAPEFQLALGSASAIFACGLAKLGHAVTFISSVGDDTFGRFCLDALERANVPTRWVSTRAGRRTGATISLSTRKDRAMVTYLGAIAELEYDDIPIDALEGCSHLHLTSYFLQRRLQPAFPRILAEAKRLGLSTSFDLNGGSVKDGRDNFNVMFAQTDILFANELEAEQLSGLADVESAARELGRFVPTVVVKLGADGAIAANNGAAIRVPGYRVEAVDTTGAGDSFDAGFVHGFLDGQRLRECLLMGNACGALSTLQAGGTENQPDCSALREFMAAHSAARE